MDTKDTAKSASYLDLHIDTDTINNFNVSIVSFLFIYIYSVTVNPAMVVTVKHSKRLLQLNHKKQLIQ
jgi:hypothetical protein